MFIIVTFPCDNIPQQAQYFHKGTLSIIINVPTDIASSDHIPNQPHLLNKCQINMGFSHFHGIWVKPICTISNKCGIVI